MDWLMFVLSVNVSYIQFYFVSISIYYRQWSELLIINCYMKTIVLMWINTFSFVVLLTYNFYWIYMYLNGIKWNDTNRTLRIYIVHLNTLQTIFFSFQTDSRFSKQLFSWLMMIHVGGKSQKLCAQFLLAWTFI